MLDLVIRGGTIIDGTGAPSRRADVGVLGERIVRIGSIEPREGRAVVEAQGLVVAPGFIDVHNHSDGWLLRETHLAPKLSQGFTTEILMSDGISYAPLTAENAADWFVYLRSLNGLELSDYTGWESIGDYLALLDRSTAHNVAVQIPYANVRVMAAGWGRGPLDDAQMRVVRQEIEQAMDAGAAGVSTGLDYISQCFADTAELAEACAAAAPWNGLYVSHVRYKKGLLNALAEAVEIGRRSGLAVHISHLKATTAAETERVLEFIDRAAGEVDISFDVYPYLAGSTMLNYLLPYEVWEAGPLSVAARLREPAIRRKLERLLAAFGTPLDMIQLAWFPSRARAAWQGRSLADYVEAQGGSPANALADLLIEEHLAGLAVIHAGEDAAVEPFLQHPRFMLGSDGIYFEQGAIHPRVYGSATRMLGPLVRDRKLFSLEDAVRKMTSWPAERFGLLDRGVVREGAFADLALFNRETVRDLATYDQPCRHSQGIERVFVNGTLVWSDGAPAPLTPEDLPGQALRFRR